MIRLIPVKLRVLTTQTQSDLASRQNILRAGAATSDTHTDPSAVQQDTAAAGFRAPPGEKELWWVQTFEARRHALAKPSGAPASSRASSSLPNRVTRVVLQLVQLAVVLAALILWPASLVPGGWYTGRVWLMYCSYWLFFAGGSVYRILAFGPLSTRSKDAQGRSWITTASWAVFVMSMPILHWYPMTRYLKTGHTHFTSGYDVAGCVMLGAAVALNWWSTAHLGKSYDRVVVPEKLITSGPYAIVQNPTYTSYMLLFAGYSMALHSGPCAIAVVLVCMGYYTIRCKLEQQVLSQAFGQEYQIYLEHTRKFWPGIY